MVPDVLLVTLSTQKQTIHINRVTSVTAMVTHADHVTQLRECANVNITPVVQNVTPAVLVFMAIHSRAPVTIVKLVHVQTKVHVHSL